MGQRASRSLRLAKTHFYACVVAVLGVLDSLFDGFYYEPKKAVLDLWLSVDGVFLSFYGVGCGLFLAAVLRSTRYAPRAVTPHTRP